MTAKQKRVRIIILFMASLTVALALALYALKDNISHFRSPSDVAILQAARDPAVAPGHVFRLGGLVVAGSVDKKVLQDGVELSFVVTDTLAEARIVYHGIPPDLFREGQGVVATGSFDVDGVFRADALLAKHDEKYMPPEVAGALKDAHEKGRKEMMGAP